MESSACLTTLLVPIENIKEIRSGPSTRLHRHHFQLAQEYENLWLTLIYILDGHYKILHLIAPSEDIFRMWDTTLRRLYAYRMQLMTGLGNIEERQRVWEKQYWKGADMDKDQRLTFEEVEKMCRRLNINSPREDLLGWFQASIPFLLACIRPADTTRSKLTCNIERISTLKTFVDSSSSSRHGKISRIYSIDSRAIPNFSISTCFQDSCTTIRKALCLCRRSSLYLRNILCLLLWRQLILLL